MTQFKLGRREPAAYHPHLKMRRYMRGNLPDPPATLDETAAAMSSLSRVMLNDSRGDCVIAWLFGHQRGVWTAAAGALEVTSDTWIERLYEVIGGYNPSDPSTDTGANVQDAFAYMVKKGVDEAVGYVAVNPSDATELRLAAWLFGGVTFGANLPQAWVDDMSNLHWRVAGPPVSGNGHCFGCPAKYDGSTMATSTWGQVGSIDDAAIARYCAAENGGEAWAVLSPWWLNRVTHLAPSGFDVDRLRADLAAIS